MTGKRVLVIGGYGGFGARLARRLAEDGWFVLVGGRNADKARAMAATLPRGEGLAIDRTAIGAMALTGLKLDLVIDAAGPFQTSGMGVITACIVARIPYLDLADAREFVGRVNAFDADAKAAGIAVISGASSVPALSGAVLRDLMAGLDTASSVDLAISASDRATAGTSVSSAILSYAGQPIRLWNGQGWRLATGWHRIRREVFHLRGLPPLKRLVALVDVPDHDLVPQMLPGRPAVTFRAGPEFAFQLIGIWLLSWIVAWRWTGSLVPLAPLLRRLQRLTAPLCSDRSAMSVTLCAEAGGRKVIRRWTLLADRGDGPEVPVLAAHLLARRIASGTLAPGARHAGGELALSDFDPLFARLAIVTGTESSGRGRVDKFRPD
ncbi:MAG: SDR family NAD(P)-dependent oxidoreductase [Proteobacteria bacterium]|nr:SDR family NAD(P)-dependent oxidoreductase [Pseudomonadota bacterium]